jgi:hypothetical protein
MFSIHAALVMVMVLPCGMPGFLVDIFSFKNPHRNAVGENIGVTTWPGLSTQVMLCDTARNIPVTERFRKEINNHMNCVGCKVEGCLRTGHEDLQVE